MNTFNIGDRVQVSEAYRAVVPQTPLPGKVLVVCAAGDYLEDGEVPIAYNGETYYVPAEYVQAA